MRVQRFRTMEEMNAAPVPAIRGSSFERFLDLCSSFHRIAPRRRLRGVFKFRTIEEAHRARENDAL